MNAIENNLYKNVHTKIIRKKSFSSLQRRAQIQLNLMPYMNMMIVDELMMKLMTIDDKSITNVKCMN